METDPFIDDLPILKKVLCEKLAEGKQRLKIPTHGLVPAKFGHRKAPNTYEK